MSGWGWCDAMNIRRILVTGRLYAELAALLPDKRPDKAFRFVAEEELTDDDFVWADAYVGFRPAGPFSLANLRWVHSLGAGVTRFYGSGNGRRMCC